jgi:hypothetical protein
VPRAASTRRAGGRASVRPRRRNLDRRSGDAAEARTRRAVSAGHKSRIARVPRGQRAWRSVGVSRGGWSCGVERARARVGSRGERRDTPGGVASRRGNAFPRPLGSSNEIRMARGALIEIDFVPKVVLRFFGHRLDRTLHPPPPRSTLRAALASRVRVRLPPSPRDSPVRDVRRASRRLAAPRRASPRAIPPRPRDRVALRVRPDAVRVPGALRARRAQGHPLAQDHVRLRQRARGDGPARAQG